jgi:hypothetical protein
MPSGDDGRRSEIGKTSGLDQKRAGPFQSDPLSFTPHIRAILHSPSASAQFPIHSSAPLTRLLNARGKTCKVCAARRRIAASQADSTFSHHCVQQQRHSQAAVYITPFSLLNRATFNSLSFLSFFLHQLSRAHSLLLVLCSLFSGGDTRIAVASLWLFFLLLLHLTRAFFFRQVVVHQRSFSFLQQVVVSSVRVRGEKQERKKRSIRTLERVVWGKDAHENGP